MPKALRYGLISVCLLAVGVGIFATFYVKTLTPRIKARVIRALEDRFDADIDLKTVSVALLPRPEVTGEELTIRHRQWNTPHPLIYIRRFRAATDYTTLLDWRNRVDIVNLEGLEIHISPHGGATVGEGGKSSAGANRLRFVIQTIEANGALLEIEPKQAGKDPLRFQIQQLVMHSVGPGKAMSFTTKLMNARPPGLIDSTGNFGPWQRDDPGSTAVSGDYALHEADLGVFKGISGILSSDGSYHGVLERIDVDGKTSTPKFDLRATGDPVPLNTIFHAIVDGINGDTILDPVDATFLHSEFICKGTIVQQPGAPGKTVTLDAITKRARMEDILKLVVGGKPIVTGDVNFTSKIEIPPGHEEVIDKLKLDGQFALVSATFTSPKAQRRLNTLSDRARGVNKNEEDNSQGGAPAVASNLRGRFKLARAEASFAGLSFRVPGAEIGLAGTYNLLSGKVDMNGQFRMQATLSETQSGVRHILLKPLDRFFEKPGAGFELPIEVSGTRDQPVIGATVFHRKFEVH